MKSIVRGIFFNIILVLAIILGLYGIYTLVYVVEPVRVSYIQELGDAPQTDIHYYLYGSEYSLKYSHVDFSDIDFNKPGLYTLHVNHGFETFDFGYEITDTLSPVIDCSEDIIVCETGRVYEADFFFNGASDLEEVSVTLMNPLNDEAVVIKDAGQSVSFLKRGNYSLCILATDEAGNSSSSFVNIKTGSAPNIFGTTEFYVAIGSALDIKANISAYDAEDGMLSQYITEDFDRALFHKEGDHVFYYHVVDSDGLTANRKGIVHVYDTLLLQDKINRGELSAYAVNVAGVVNPYDLGYTVEDNIQAVVDGLNQVVVCVYYDRGNIRTRGSGYVVSADTDRVMIATNHHVVSDNESVQIAFPNGNVYTGRVEARSDNRDIAFVSIPTEDFGNNIKNIKTIHINANYYESLGNRPAMELGTYCIYPDSTEWLRKYGYIVNKNGSIPDPDENYTYILTEVSMELIKGMSGSAVVDSHGNLLCMATCYYEDGGRRQYFCVTLSDILDFYAESFGTRLEYY